ncbi:MAG: glycosyltransferase [Armatimonadetes bacterium]|nr:glycosyltransferase [Armatimonadota bacterium]
MNILMVNKFYHLFGGSERYCFDLSDLLESRGHKVIPFAMAHPANRPSPYASFFVDQQDYNRLLKASPWRKLTAALRSFYSLEARRKLENLVGVVRPALAHLHLIQHQLTPSVLSVLKSRGVPAVMTLHEYQLICPNYRLYCRGDPCADCRDRRFLRAATRRCVKNSLSASLMAAVEMHIQRLWPLYRQAVSRFIAPSRFMAETMASFGWPEDRIRTIPHPVRLPTCRFSPPDTPYAFYFGRLAPEKGLETLLSALEKAGEVALYIAGEGEMRPFLERKAEKMGERVKFLGFQEGEPLRRLIAGARFVVVPSEWYEVFGLTITEAFSHRKAVVGAEIGAIPELVKHGSTGLLFPPGSAEALAACLQALWNRPQEAREMGQTGWQLVREICDPERHYQSIRDLYQEVTA